MNEDRARFFTALGIGFCGQGNHATEHAYHYPPDGQTTYCWQHPAPAGPVEPPQRGTCKVGRIHKADAVYWVPVMGIHVCRRHLASLLAEVIRRGEYGS
jgi:hypothetical protein